MSARDVKKNDTKSAVPGPRNSPELIPANRQPQQDSDVLTELRYRDSEKKKRSRRHLLVLSTLVAFLLAATTIAAGQLSGWWTIGALDREIEGLTDKCDNVGMVPAPNDISVQVMNGTATAGLATTLADDLRARDFQVRGTGNSSAEVAASNVTITYPAGLKTSAEVVAANFDAPIMQLHEAEDNTVKVQINADTAALVNPNVAAERVSVLVDKGQELQNLCRTGR